ncbi:hypothetical protein QEG73_20525 [Chitinophagaceae bacterium 26-R-25]|nr:hypothetical protein [Chitinophagaceae bacterium 26-R-25]
MLKKLLILIPMFIGVARTYSQSVDSTRDDKKLSLKLGTEFISNQSYVGRTDSMNLPVIIPYVNFETRFGVFVKTSAYLNLSGGAVSFDGVSIEPGYEFSKNNWDGSISFTKNFISQSSNLIVAPVKSAIDFYLQKTYKIITPSIGAEYLFSDEGNDFIFYTGVSKEITLAKYKKSPLVSIDPAITVNGGSQNFYYSFLKNYSGNGHGKNSGSNKKNNPVPVTQTTEDESSRFALLSTSFELPISITKGKFEWKTTPAYELPFNLAASGQTGTQQAQPYFYIRSELIYSF